MENTEFTAYKKNSSRHGHDNDMLDENQVRQVAGCIALDVMHRRVLLISSRKKKNTWVLPKGGWEKDETQQHAAQRETWEEAGIKGKIIKPLGVFEEYTKKKHRLKAHHWIFEMHIDEVVKKYPERKKRNRRWFTLDEAMIVTRKHPYIQQALLQSSLKNHMSQAQKMDPIETKSIIDQTSLSDSFQTLFVKD
ncbi:hypothetical protein G6F56_010317 [Rhizopus delemar]|nr:hypothetical protein G6F56_010317 [Rhizopus delemar]